MNSILEPAELIRSDAEMLTAPTTLRCPIITMLAVAFVCTGCASNEVASDDESVVVTGTAVSRSEVEGNIVDVVRVEEGESAMDALLRLGGAEHYPTPGSFDSREELVSQLDTLDIAIESMTENEVAVRMPRGFLLTYNVDSADCLPR